MKNSLSPSMPMGTNEWHGLTKWEYVAIEVMTALTNVYGSKGEGHHKDPA